MSRKTPDGGLYDPTESPLYFLASQLHHLVQAVESCDTLLVAVNELGNGAAADRFDRLLDSGAKILLDSGIYNLTNEHARKYGVSMNEALTLAPDEIEGFDKLWDRYCSTVTAYADRLWGFIELDQGGAVNKRRTRARIESETGMTPMPVYHPLVDGHAYFDELCESYDRVCFGNVVQADYRTRKHLIHTLYERQRADHPDVWIHVLGFTMNEWHHSLPWYGSCDSSSWTRNLRWAGSNRSHASAARVGLLLQGTRYRYGAERDDPDGYHKAELFASAQEGWFLEKTVAAFAAAKESL